MGNLGFLWNYIQQFWMDGMNIVVFQGDSFPPLLKFKRLVIHFNRVNRDMGYILGILGYIGKVP